MKFDKDAKKKVTVLAILPLIFAVVTIFFTYKSLETFLISGLALVLFEFALWHDLTKKLSDVKAKLSVVLPLALILVGSIGISASSTLTREKIELAKNPDFVTSCSVSPIVACSPVIGSDQASAFGIPNPLFGIFGYGALIIAGFSLLAGKQFKAYWWRSLWAGTAFGFAFVLWLISETLYDIGALCIYCMVAWSVTIPIFYYVTLHNFQHGYFKGLPKKHIEFFSKNHLLLPVLTILVIITMIYFRFQEYWNSLI